MSNLTNNQDISEQMLLLQYKHELEMSDIHKTVAEKIFVEKIESHLGFSLSDDDARYKLNQISDIIEIPDVLYQFVA